MIKKIITPVLLICTLTACSKTPDCSSSEAVGWFNSNLAPIVNSYSQNLVNTPPITFTLDDVQTLKHENEINSFSCKANLRVDIPKEDIKAVLDYQGAAKKDDYLVNLPDNVLNEAGKGDTAARNTLQSRVGMLQFGLEFIQSNSKASELIFDENAGTPNEKMYIKIPVIYVISAIKSKSANFKVETKYDPFDLSSEAIYLSRIFLFKTLLAHPEIVAASKEASANAIKEKQAELDKQQSDNDAALATKNQGTSAPSASSNPTAQTGVQPTAPTPQKGEDKDVLGQYNVSFDCSKASSNVEKLTCSTPMLSQLDGLMTATYKSRMDDSSFGVDKGAFNRNQHAWLKTKNSCSDVACLNKTYRQRIEDLCSMPVISGVHPIGDCDAIKN